MTKVLRMKKIPIVKALFIFQGFLSFSSVTLIPNEFLYFSSFFVFLVGVFYLINKKTLDRRVFLFFLSFLLISLVGFVGFPVSYVIENVRFAYDELVFVGRVINLIVFATIIVFYDRYMRDGNDDLGLIFRWYQVGILVLLITALWHVVSMYTSIIDFPFDTRSSLHSDYGHEYSFEQRVTGIAREPSYFVAFAVDFIAVSMLLYKKSKKIIMISFSSLLIFLSLSPSGYILLIGASLFASFFTGVKFFHSNKIKFLFGFLFIVMLVFVISKISESHSYLQYIMNRVANADIHSSSRVYMLAMPFYWVQESSVFSLIFGHGVKSYSIIGSNYLLPSGMPVHATSNSVYVDIFWESGLLGLFLLVSFYSVIFYRIMRSRFSRSQVFISFFVLFDLLISGFFRADFASPRYFVMLYLLFILINYDLRSLRGFYVENSSSYPHL